MRKEDLYLPGGLLNMRAVISDRPFFKIVIAARGGGKTYGTLLTLLQDKRKFLYLRTKKSALDIACSKEYNPFKVINTDHNLNIKVEYGKGIGRVIDGETGDCVGYMGALSTFANLRGIDGSDIDVIVWDEFIPQPEEVSRFDSYLAFLHAYETINRNRELKGCPPVQVVLLSNSDLIYGDVVTGLKIGDRLLYMQESGEEIWEDEERGLLVLMPKLTAFEEQKAQTAIYKLAQDSEFSDVALKNKFPVEDRGQIVTRNLREYIPVSRYGGVTFYKHKSNGKWYCTRKNSGTPKDYGTGKSERVRFIRENPSIWLAHLRRKLEFSGIDAQTIFRKMYN